MSRTLTAVVAKLLKQTGVNISRIYLEKRLTSHPDYPSLVSITDTLDELGIDNGAYVIDKANLQDLPFPFLAHSKKNGGEFTLVTGRDHLQQQEVLNDWDGIGLFVEKPDNWTNTENENALREERKQSRQILAFSFLLILLSFAAASSGSWMMGVAGTLAAAGLFVSFLIIQKELGISNEVTEKLCDSMKGADCDAVINSAGGRIGNKFTLADAGIIFFTAFILFVNTSGSPVYAALLSACTIPFTLFSLYYQWRVAKAWCALCLITLAVLWAQAAALSPYLINLSGIVFQLPAIASLVFSFFFTATAWLYLVKPLLKQHRLLKHENADLQRFKYKTDIFQSILKRQRRIDTAMLPGDLQIGNENASQQLIVACSPYCGPCGTTHKLLHDLIEKKDIGVTIRFSIKSEKRDDKRFQAVTFLLRLMKNTDAAYKRKVLHDWFEIMDLEKFKTIYQIGNNNDIQEEITYQRRWAEEAKIAFTPTIFLNSYEFPKEYNRAELVELMRAEYKKNGEATYVSVTA